VSPKSRARKRKAGGRARPGSGGQRPGSGARTGDGVTTRVRHLRPSVGTYLATALADVSELVRQRSALQVELWASVATSAFLPEKLTRGFAAHLDDAVGFVGRAVGEGGTAAHVMLAALAVVGAPAELREAAAEGARMLAQAAPLPQWAARIGQASCAGAWFGPADPYRDQDLAVLSFGYEGDSEPHVVAVLIDRINGGFAVDAFTDDPSFVQAWARHTDAGRLSPVAPAVAAGEILDAFDLTDRVLGVPVTESLVDERSFVLARTRVVPDPVQPEIADPASDQACEALASRFLAAPHAEGLLEVAGAREALGQLLDFVGGWPEDRLLWWSPARASIFLTHWLPRKAVMSGEGIAATPDVVRAWTRFVTAGLAEKQLAAIFDQIDRDAPGLAARMADQSQAGLGKQIALGREPDLSYLLPGDHRS